MAVTITVRVTSRRSECVAENQINKKNPRNLRESGIRKRVEKSIEHLSSLRNIN